MDKLERAYLSEVNTRSDINEHLPTLRMLAMQGTSVLELGVREGVSTLAFLMAKPKIYIGVDIVANQKANDRLAMRHSETHGLFIYADSRYIDIKGRFDLLFIDTFHTRDVCMAELVKHSNNIDKYIVLHDTETYGLNGEDGSPGLRWAVDNFLKGNDSWHMLEHYPNNNGLTVLERINNANY